MMRSNVILFYIKHIDNYPLYSSCHFNIKFDKMNGCRSNISIGLHKDYTVKKLQGNYYVRC